ncbi:hypothetical protein [Persephonella sp.]
MLYVGNTGKGNTISIIVRIMLIIIMLIFFFTPLVAYYNTDLSIELDCLVYDNPSGECVSRADQKITLNIDLRNKLKRHPDVYDIYKCYAVRPEKYLLSKDPLLGDFNKIELKCSKNGNKMLVEIDTKKFVDGVIYLIVMEFYSSKYKVSEEARRKFRIEANITKKTTRI